MAHALSRQGKGWFEERLGPGTKIEWFVYNAGPSAMEAIFAKSIDLTYVGPGPALNAYNKIERRGGPSDCGRRQWRIAALVVQPDQNLKSAGRFSRKENCDAATRAIRRISRAAPGLTAGGLKITQLGGDAQVIADAKPGSIAIVSDKREIDAVWTVEPWVSRLEQEAGG